MCIQIKKKDLSFDWLIRERGQSVFDNTNYLGTPELSSHSLHHCPTVFFVNTPIKTRLLILSMGPFTYSMSSKVKNNSMDSQNLAVVLK